MGILITKGMKLSIPAGGLVLGLGGDGVTPATLKVEVGLSLYPVWLEIALQHLREAKSAQNALEIAHRTGDEAAKVGHIEREFVHGMQSVVASATAVEAFYEVIKPFSKFSNEALEALRENRKSRSKHIKEAIRRVFSLKDSEATRIGDVLEEIYRFRVNAVHPPAGSGPPVLHSILNVGVEWRFVTFSHANAREIFRGSSSLISQLLKKGAKLVSPIQNQCLESLPSIEAVLREFEMEESDPLLAPGQPS